MTYKKYDVVIVPFPFTDSSMQKRRPALVLSDYTAFSAKTGHSIMAMITSAKNAPWPLDVRITDLSQAGLPAPSVVRMKLFTLDHRFIFAKAGVLSPGDAAMVNKALHLLLALQAVPD